MSTRRQAILFLEACLFAIPVFMGFSVLMCIGIFASISGGDDSPPTSGIDDRVILILAVVVSLLVGYAIARRRARGKARGDLSRPGFEVVTKRDP